MEAVGWPSSRERRPFPLAWPKDDGGVAAWSASIEACSCHLWRLRLEFQRFIQGNWFPSRKN